jgi:molybdopterin converting factor small subunit
MLDLTDGEETINIPGSTVSQVIDNLDLKYPGIKNRICRDGALKSGMALVIQGQVSKAGLNQVVAPECEIHFLPNIGGG